MIRPVGHRALIRPIDQPSDATIIDINPERTNVGVIVSVGRPRCTDCGAPIEQALTPGMRVALRPGCLYDEVTDTVRGLELWMVNVEDVIGEVLPLESA